MQISSGNDVLMRTHVSSRLHSKRWSKGCSTGAVFDISIKESSFSSELYCTFTKVIAAPVKKQQAGCRLLFISDLHQSGLNPVFQGKFADEINKLSPDWIVFGGDLCMYMDAVDDALAWLGKLHAKCGKCAVPGNRESPVVWLDTAFWKRKYAEAGFQYLCNEMISTDSFRICGIDDCRFGKPDWTLLEACANLDVPVITVTHNPDAAGLADNVAYLGDLLLCGHTHAGQICLPFFGPFYSSSAFGRQFLHGFHQRDDGSLCLVSSGIGESGQGFYKCRLNCPREVTLIEF